MKAWWKKTDTIPLAESNFQKIIKFYLFECPCETEKGSSKKRNKSYTAVSKQGITLRQKGWTRGNLITLLSAMKRTSSGHLEYHIFSSSQDISAETYNIEKGTSLSDQHFEMIVMSERSDMSKTSSIFYYIRNALAHGSFCQVSDCGKKIYYFESIRNNKVLARIRLREKTLLNWIEDFRSSPEELKARKNNKRSSRFQKT